MSATGGGRVMGIRGMTGCALLVAALAVPATAGAGRANGGRTAGTVVKTIKVDSTYTEPAPAVEGFECRFSPLGQERYEEICKQRYMGPATFTGTFAMDAVYDLLGWTDRNGNERYEGFNVMKGTIPGCGTGTFVLDEPYGIIYRESFDPAEQSLRGYNTWFVRKGSGTGGLRGLVSGRGENHWTAYVQRGHDGRDGFGEGRFTGRVRCRVPAERRDRSARRGAQRQSS